MNETCGCCEGTHSLTPAPVINRPGLTAISYRVGKHASFLETMKARLSSLELSSEDFEGDDKLIVKRLRPLLDLTTRSPSDPAIALLDTWAIVADVLTFYQERIANEGFLRTATERRSILELARLIGYRLRPGVAASVFFAYTLEQDSEVEVPSGARAQSVPGPGDLPQSFETSEKLEARTDWNTLQVRLTRPQVPTRGKPLYFKGTDTNLKPNDPLLINLAGEPRLLRVRKVEPDQIAGRTRVTFQLWDEKGFGPDGSKVSVAAGSAASLAAAPTSVSLAELRRTIDRFARAEGFEVNTSTATAQRVIGHLTDLGKKLAQIQSNAELQQLLEATLPALREEHRLATEGNFSKLLPWISAIVTRLEQRSTNLAVTGARVSGSVDSAFMLAAASRGPGTFEPINAKPPANQKLRSSLTDVSQLVTALEKPPFQPPVSSQYLNRSIAAGFSAASDVLPKLLVTMRPALRDVFYRAWESLTVTTPLPVSVYALRARASVFGHNAPRKPIIDDETGRVLGTEEWTLFRDTSPPVRERFKIDFSASAATHRAKATISIAMQTDTVRGTAEEDLAEGVEFSVKLEKDNDLFEAVVVKVTGATDRAPKGLTVLFQFKKRRFAIEAVSDDQGSWSVRPVISDPSKLRISKLSATTNSLVVISGNLEFVSPGTPTEEPDKVSLDTSYKEIVPGSWAVLEKPLRANQTEAEILITSVLGLRETSRADYGITGAGTQLQLATEWIKNGDGFEVIRGTRVFAQSELLELAEEPIDPEGEPVRGAQIELANLVRGLEPGRWLIVSGERVDITQKVGGRENVAAPENSGETIHAVAGIGATTGETGSIERLSETDGTAEPAEKTLSGISSSELVMLAGIEQGYDARFPGDKTHTTIVLAKDGLANSYKRDTVTIYGNVVKATHGETKKEVLGSGDGSQSMQQFVLHQSPLTYLSKPTPAGAESTLRVRVNDVLWHEAESLVGLGPKDRSYTTRTDDKDQTTVVFGNGQYGARLPTGVENISAVYRAGIGRPGNVKAEQISSLLTKPLGVKSVINPMPASGGADREDRDQARRNAPLAVMALDRLISVQDYEDFARTYAGIAKASAARISDGRRQVVHLTIAGSDDIPIDTTSDLFVNLRQSLLQFGDPNQSIQLAVRQLKLLIISANVRVLPDYLWETVEPKIRTALLKRLSFAQSELGQDAFASEAVSIIQAQEGVAYVDLNAFDAVAEDTTAEQLANLSNSLGLQPRIPVDKAMINPKATDPAKRILPAQLAYLSPAVADTLILNPEPSR